MFPGLEGSRVWHGDTNCDLVYNENDRVTFMARVASGSCSPFCSLPPAGQRATPTETANMLLAYPGPPEFDVLAAVATERDNARDQDSAQFWSDVLDVLLR